MKNLNQFWSLLKFQTTISLWFWIMPLIFGMPLILSIIESSYTKNYHPSLDVLLINQNLMFVLIFGSVVLAPEKFQIAAANMAASYTNSEFLLTRAIDRPVLYRAKTALLYFLVLSLPIIAIIYSLQKPDLTIFEDSKSMQQECLTHIPGSTLVPVKDQKSKPTLVSLPRGNILACEWQFWSLLSFCIFAQISILILYPVKYGQYLYWALFFGTAFLPLYDLRFIGKNVPTLNEQIFFSFTANHTFYWILTGFTFFLTQLWCERRFSRLEQ